MILTLSCCVFINEQTFCLFYVEMYLNTMSSVWNTCDISKFQTTSGVYIIKDMKLVQFNLHSLHDHGTGKQ